MKEDVSYRNLISAKAAQSKIFVFQTLFLGKPALSRFSTGHVIDLVSNDVQRMEEVPVWFCAMMTSVTYNRDSNVFALVFDWLASSYGSNLFMFSWTILRLDVLFWYGTTPAHSSRIWPANFLDDRGSFWNPRYQDAWMGGRIPRKDWKYTKTNNCQVAVKMFVINYPDRLSVILGKWSVLYSW